MTKSFEPEDDDLETEENEVDCTSCDGTGNCQDCVSGFVDEEETEECETCEGTGDCQECDGNGIEQ